MSEEKKDPSQAVREMFSSIAGHYDLLNHLLSFNIDKRWRAACARDVDKRLTGSNPLILDVGCGTADLSLEFARVGRVLGCDFSQPMLSIGAHKVARSGRMHSVHLTAGDAEILPFARGSFDAVVSAFVVRNLANPTKGIEEMRRVMKTGGTLAILDFGMPRQPAFAALYRFYFHRILPAIGTRISGVKGAYRYLPRSVAGFHTPEGLAAIVGRAGFRQVEWRPLSFGIAFVLTALADGCFRMTRGE